MKRILALTGPKGSGKSTIASILRHNHGVFLGAPVYSFASRLKDMLRLTLPPEAFYAENKEDPEYGLFGKSPRFLMQDLGSWGRKIHPEFWTEILKRNIQESSAKTILIDDLRHENEAEMIQDLGGVIYLVERPGVKYTGEHETENGIDPAYIDGVIPNRTKEDLTKFLKNFNPFYE